MTALETLDGEATWGIGRFLQDGQAISLTVPLARMREDVEFARWALVELGAVPERPIIIVFSTADGAQFAPFEYAARDLGIPYAAVEPSSYDAGRLVMFCRGLRPSAVIGLRAEVLAGLPDLDTSVEECLADAGPVLAFPSAYPELVAAGVPARRWVPLGPTIVVGCASGGLHLSSAWELGTRDGEVCVSSRIGTPALDAVPTGVLGSIARDACWCGRAGPRLVLEEPADVRP